MQNIDEILPAYLSRLFKTAAVFLFFEVETCFCGCNPILGSCLGVLKELGNKQFFS